MDAIAQDICDNLAIHGFKAIGLFAKKAVNQPVQSKAYTGENAVNDSQVVIGWDYDPDELEEGEDWF